MTRDPATPPIPDVIAPRTVAGQGNRGVLVAATILLAWGTLLAALLAAPLDGIPIALLVLGGLLQTLLYTGLFITAHDAMHGVVAPGRPRLNDAIGRLVTALYAAFPFDRLREKHHGHHRTPAEPGADPDYHDGRHPGFVRWYLHFVLTYVSWPQLLAMALVFNLLEHGAGVPAWRLLAFWVAPSLLSTLQLFLFGTWLPHRPHRWRDAHRARSNAYAPWLSLLTCYHFGYHWEHHAFPWLPWWRLPEARALGLEPRGEG